MEEIKRVKEEEIAEVEEKLEKLQDKIRPTLEQIDYLKDHLSDLRGDLEEATERDRRNQGGD